MNSIKKYIHTVLWISLVRDDTSIELSSKKYTLQMHQDFIENIESKKHNFLSHLTWFIKKIKINHEKENNLVINRWKICSVDYGVNIGTEINGVRPSIVFKSSSAKYGEDTIVIPITSYENIAPEWKSKDEYDILIEPASDNNLSKPSLIKIRQIRCISKKRIRPRKGNITPNIFWEIRDIQIQEQIIKSVQKLFWI